MNRPFFISLAALALLTSCSLTTPRDVGNAHRVMLKPLAEKATCRTRVGSLIVGYPKAPETLDTAQIALLEPSGRLDYFAGMRWADFLPGNVQSALIASLTASGRFAAVSADDTAQFGRLILDSEISQFAAVYHADDTAPDVEIKIAFALREGDSASIRKQFVAHSKVHAAGNNVAAIGRALEQAFAEVQRAALKNLGAARQGCQE